jgi:hypothetical protein
LAERKAATPIGFHSPSRESDARGAIDQMPNLTRRRSLLDIGARNILEHRHQIEFLLVLSAERVAGLLADNREDRLVVQQRIRPVARCCKEGG